MGFVSDSFAPVFDADSKILILGSFPSVKSREEGFYYGNPRNRFWPLMAELFGEAVPQTVDEKKSLLLRHHIALWDVAKSCVIEGSGDNTIREVEPVPIREITDNCELEAVFANGSTAWAMYMEYLYPITQMPCLKLPSTSPANAAVKLEQLIKKWQPVVDEDAREAAFCKLRGWED